MYVELMRGSPYHHHQRSTAMKLASCRPFLSPSALRRRPHNSPAPRSYAIQTPGAPMLQVFNNQTKYLQRERAASDPIASRKVDYLRDEIASRLCERLLDINRHFSSVLDYGANACNLAHAITRSSPPLTARISSLVSADSSPTLLHRDASLPYNDLLNNHTRTVLPIPDTAPLPFLPASFSAAISSLSMHWINDLPSALAQINRILKPDSPFLAAMLGGDSLYELRTSLQLADLDRRGGVSTHTSPLADVRDMGSLLTKAGFNLLTVDVDDVIVDYPSSFALMMDLQAMGEGNAVLGGGGAGALSREVLLAMDGIYRELHGNNDGTVPATFRVIFMIGWTGGEGQARPLKRGSGKISMKDVLEDVRG